MQPWQSTHQVLWCHMATWIWVNIGLGNGLLPDGTKSLPEPLLTWYRWGSVAFNWEQFSINCSKSSIGKIYWKIIHLRLLSNLPGDNELNDTIRILKYKNYMQLFMVVVHMHALKDWSSLAHPHDHPKTNHEDIGTEIIFVQTWAVLILWYINRLQWQSCAIC